MAYRVFTDSSGTDWQAWDVAPTAIERRVGERRVMSDAVGFVERRRRDRRVVAGRWSPLTSGLRDGWLCFDGKAGRRRLTPVPADWEHCAESTLERYCRSAQPVRVMMTPARAVADREADRPHR